uniref:pectin lyase n=1 Tax=Hyaloperonospora arabidopsidis (strain Emoy2) TaxID=559515 RepID=M4BUR4_HYAAE
MNSTGGCINGTKVTLKYDNAGIQRVAVMGNKTLRGIGKVGVILGKGLSLSGDNIIIQNVHVTEINPHVIWGGDAIVIRSSRHSTAVLNKIWLDHVKVSRISRQMVVASGAGVTMTISNSDFDGRTDFSILCHGHHYWTFLFYGQKTATTMLNNYIYTGPPADRPRLVVKKIRLSSCMLPTTTGATIRVTPWMWGRMDTFSPRATTSTTRKSLLYAKRKELSMHSTT